MAVVHLKDVWVHRGDDFSEFRTFRFVGGLSSVDTSDTYVQKLAGGRLRAITRAGSRTEWSLSLLAVDGEQLDWLRENKGRLVMVRNHREKLFGVFAEVSVTERVYNREADVTLTLSQVSASEEV